MTRTSLLVGLVIFVLLNAVAPSPSASTPLPKLAAEGSEFQVNTYTTQKQYRQAVAAHDGGFVVVWTSGGSFETDPDMSIQARRYDVNGQPLGDQFQVNTYTTGSQSRPGVAAWPDGRFAVVWTEFVNPDHRIRGRLFSSDGVPEYEEFSLDERSILEPSVDVVGEAVLVIWEGNGAVDRDVFGQALDASGTPVGSTFLVNSQTTGSQNDPVVRAAPDGSFRVVWSSETSTGDDPSFSIQTRQVAADGTPLATDFQVNSYTTGGSYRPALDFAPDGRFVVAFTSYGGSPGDDTLDGAISARRFDSAGAPAGDDFQVNSHTGGAYGGFSDHPHVRVDQQGDFVVAWSGHGVGASDPLDYSVVVDRFDSAGVRVGAELDANTLRADFLEPPPMAMRASGDFVVVWESYESLGDDDLESSVQARFFQTEADVSVTTTDGVEVATPGGAVTHTIEVANAGPDAATNASLTDVQPSELDCTFTSVASGGATGQTAAGAGDLDETLLLPSGAGVTYTLDCDVAPDARGELVHQVTIAADQVDGDSANDQATDTDTLAPSTDLSVELALSDLFAGQGDIETIRATVTNLGPSASFGGTLIDALPAEIGFSSSSDCSVDMGAVLCSVPALDPGEDVTVEYQVLVDSMVPVGTNFVVDVTVTTPEADPDGANDSDSATLTVVVAGIFADGFETGDIDAWSSSVP